MPIFCPILEKILSSIDDLLFLPGKTDWSPLALFLISVEKVLENLSWFFQSLESDVVPTTKRDPGNHGDGDADGSGLQPGPSRPARHDAPRRTGPAGHGPPDNDALHDSRKSLNQPS